MCRLSWLLSRGCVHARELRSNAQLYDVAVELGNGDFVKLIKPAPASQDSITLLDLVLTQCI